MKEITELLAKELAEIEGLLAQSNRNISKTKNLPNIHVNVCNNNGYEQAYRIDPVAKTRKYIKASDLPSYTKLIQRDYEHAINSKLTQMDKNLKRIIEAYKKVNLSDIELMYSKLANIKKDMIIPIVPDEESFIQSWKEEHPGYQNPFPHTSLWTLRRIRLYRRSFRSRIGYRLPRKGSWAHHPQQAHLCRDRTFFSHRNKHPSFSRA